jgi:streptogramin lyase
MRNVFLTLALLVTLLFGLVPGAEASPAQDALEPTGEGQAAAPAPFAASPALAPARPEALTDKGTLIQYALPITPTHLIAAPNGQIWYSSFFGSAIGNLDPATLVSRLYKLPEEKSVFGVQVDAAGNVWYSTANAAGGNDAVGRLNAVTNLISEWRLPRNHFGLHVDPATQNVWFVSKGTASDQVVRLAPQTSQLTLWNLSPYTDTYNLDIAPNGEVWFTVQPRGLQGVGRLVPSTGQVTVWKMPSPAARPFQLHVVSPNEVWLTEFDASGNSVSRLTPGTNRLARYLVPTANSGPGGVIKIGDRVWFTEYDGNKVGRLDPADAAAQEVTLQTETYVAPSTVTTIAPVTIAPQVLKSASNAGKITLLGARSGGFVEFPLPVPNSYPLEIVAGGQDAVWFAEMGGARISAFRLNAAGLFLPGVMK